MKRRRPSAALDSLTKTFTSDQRYCDALLLSEHRVPFARMLVYYRWAREYLPHVQAGLLLIAEKRFPDEARREAKAWTAFLVGGVLKDVCLIPYLLMRGVVAEAGVAGRRSLEHAGVLTHFWAEPSTASLLKDSDSRKFKEAFVREVDRTKAEELKRRGIQKRFAAFQQGKAASDLYAIISASDVHGDTPLNVILSLAKEDSISCGFIDRREPGDQEALFLLTATIELLCSEVSMIHGQHGKNYGVTPARVGEGGRYLASLFSARADPSSVMNKEVTAVLRDLGVDD